MLKEGIIDMLHKIEEIISRISEPDESKAQLMSEKISDWSGGSHEDLGLISWLVERYAAITGDTSLNAPKKRTVILCADHGVAAEGVSAFTQDTTLQMMQNYLISHGTAANAFSSFSGSEMLVYDLGTAAGKLDIPGLIDMRIANGTKNSAKGPAMTRDEAERSLAAGIRIAEDAAAAGCTIILPGEMGIANTTSSAAIASVICGLPPSKTTGRGTGISNERLMHKTKVVQQIIDINHPDPSDGIDVLAKVGGFELGAIAGIILGAAANGMCVILDGLNTGASALIANAISPNTAKYLIPSQLAAEPAAAAVLDKLGLKPFLNLDLRLGEAIGSSITASFLDAAIRSCRHMANDSIHQPRPHVADLDASNPSGLLACISLDSGGIYMAGGKIDKDGHFLPQKPDAKEIKDIEDIQDLLDEDHMNDIDSSPFSTVSMPKDDLSLDAKDTLSYISSLPELDQKSVDACMNRFNHLSKPVASLGTLEAIAADIAGICSEPRPSKDLAYGMVCISSGSISEPHYRLLHGMASNALADPVIFANIEPERSPSECYTFGVLQAQRAALDATGLGVALMDDEGTPYGTKAAILRESLIGSDGSMLWGADEFLGHVPSTLRGEAAAMLGVLVGAAHSFSFTILDDEATEIIARYAVKLIPDLRMSMIHIQPRLIQGNIKANGVTACLGMKLSEASLYALNEMRTFEETAVPIPIDGKGKNKAN